jgi:small-conductance mechanosensitive channel
MVSIHIIIIIILIIFILIIIIIFIILILIIIIITIIIIIIIYIIIIIITIIIRSRRDGGYLRSHLRSMPEDCYRCREVHDNDMIMNSEDVDDDNVDANDD